MWQNFFVDTSHYRMKKWTKTFRCSHENTKSVAKSQCLYFFDIDSIFRSNSALLFYWLYTHFMAQVLEPTKNPSVFWQKLQSIRKYFTSKTIFDHFLYCTRFVCTKNSSIVNFPKFQCLNIILILSKLSSFDVFKILRKANLFRWILFI